jgi:hypothetical protein
MTALALRNEQIAPTGMSIDRIYQEEALALTAWSWM